MRLHEEHQRQWEAYLADPASNPLAYGHPQQWGEVALENELCFFLQDHGGVLAGSGMIIPKALRPTVFDLTPEEFSATFELLQRAKQHLDAALNPQGYSVGWNVGPVGGQHVPQAHLHVIPRFADEPYAGRGIRYWLKQEANRRPAEE